MHTTWKRWTAMLLCVVMLLGMMPMAYAEEPEVPVVVEDVEEVVEEVTEAEEPVEVIEPAVEETAEEIPAVEETPIVEEVSEVAPTMDISVTASGTCGNKLTWKLTNGTLTISGTGAMGDYSSDSQPWYNYRDEITTIILQSNVTMIGADAFSYCDNLTSVVIPNSVTAIGDHAFYCCTSLTDVTIPGSVTTIGNNVFYYCSSLTGIWVNENNPNYSNDQQGILYTKDKTELIQAPGAIQTCVIPNSVTKIGNDAFARCFGLTSVKIGDNVTTINTRGFSYCFGLTSVIMPDGVTTIGREVFYDCDSLTNVELPSSITTIGYGAFRYCDSLAHVYYIGTEAEWNAISIGDYNSCLINAAIQYNYKVETSSSLKAPKITVSNVASTGKVKLTWNKVAGATKYKIYRSKTQNGTYSLINTVTGTGTINKNAVAGQKYYYYVVAVAADGTTSGKSNIVSRTCDLAQPVITLSNDAATGKIKISWKAVEGAVKYKVYRCKTQNGTYGLMNTVTGTSMINKNGVAGTRYYYKVVAVANNTNANSVASAIKNRVCDLARPVVTLSNVASTGKIKVSWAKIDGAVKYKVYRSTSKNGTYTLMNTVTGTSMVNKSAKPGKTYYYKVMAIANNTNANSAYSVIKYRLCKYPSAYASVIRDSMNRYGYYYMPDYFQEDCYGLLYDIDKDRQEELILRYQTDDPKWMYEIWTIKSGVAKCMVTFECWDNVEGGPTISRVHYKNNDYLVFCSRYGGSDVMCTEWEFYLITSTGYKETSYKLYTEELFGLTGETYYHVDEDINSYGETEVTKSEFNKWFANETAIPITTQGMHPDQLLKKFS